MSSLERSRLNKFPRWFWLISFAALLLSVLPYVFSYSIAPPDTLYLGINSHYDDHCVYAAWTKQAQEGRFFFENRFTPDPQPRLTVNFYFLITGWVAKVVGVPLAMHVMKFVFGFLFLFSLYRLVIRLSDSEVVRATSFATAIFGGGIGWLVWRRFGWDAPIDVWQPEAFVFPSLMMVGLFCAALFLICETWNAILDSKDSWRPVLRGFLAVFFLTNIHTYDTLAIAIVSAGFLATQACARTVTIPWLIRSVCIALGAIPSLLWYKHVLANDWVFQQRALTGTFSPTLDRILIGFGPLLVLACVALFKQRQGPQRWAPLLAILFLIVLIPIQQYSGYDAHGLWLDPIGWTLLAATMAALCAMYAQPSPIFGLLFAWTMMGIVAYYYPGLFQRKVVTGLSIPIGLLAGYAIASLYQQKTPLTRPLLAASVILLSITSLRWVQREMQMATTNTSVTTIHHIFWDKDVKYVLDYLSKVRKESDVILSRPGFPVPVGDKNPPDDFVVGLPELNGIMAAFAGIKTYYGHWSETPHPKERREEIVRDLFSRQSTLETARHLIAKSGATYLIVFKGEVARLAGIRDVSFYKQLGDIVYSGQSLDLLRVRPS